MTMSTTTAWTRRCLTIRMESWVKMGNSPNAVAFSQKFYWFSRVNSQPAVWGWRGDLQYFYDILATGSLQSYQVTQCVCECMLSCCATRFFFFLSKCMLLVDDNWVASFGMQNLGETWGFWSNFVPTDACTVDATISDIVVFFLGGVI